MKRTASSSWIAGLLATALCLLMSGGLWAQAGAKSAQGSNAPQASQSTDAATAPRPHDDSFVIGNDDVLAINVWKEPDISRSIPVRSDGKISLPLVGEVQATGQTPLKLEQEIAAKLKNYISEPEVTVIVQQINSQKFNILGQVTRPGSYVITNSATVLDAIADGWRIPRLRQTEIDLYPATERRRHADPDSFQLQRSGQGTESCAEHQAAAAGHDRRTLV